MCALVTGVQTCALPISGVLETICDRCGGVGGPIWPIHRLQPPVVKIHLLQGRGIQISLGIDELQFVSIAQRHRGSSLGAYTDPVEICRCWLRSVAFDRSEEHTSELQSLMRISYAVFCLKKK